MYQKVIYFSLKHKEMGRNGVRIVRLSCYLHNTKYQHRWKSKITPVHDNDDIIYVMHNCFKRAGLFSRGLYFGISDNINLLTLNNITLGKNY